MRFSSKWVAREGVKEPGVLGCDWLAPLEVVEEGAAMPAPHAFGPGDGFSWLQGEGNTFGGDRRTRNGTLKDCRGYIKKYIEIYKSII